MQSIIIFHLIPYAPYTNDNDNDGNRSSTLNTTYEFSNGIHVEKHGTNSG